MLVAKMGIDMGRFGTAERLSPWSGVAPGNDESAGKRCSGKTRKGNRTLRAGLTPLAHAAARTQGTSLSALYHCLATRRGQKRTILAVALVIVVRAFYRLSRNEPYREFGANYVDGHRRHQLVDRGARHLERLGYGVNNQPVTAV
jgi:transposase